MSITRRLRHLPFLVVATALVCATGCRDSANERAGGSNKPRTVSVAPATLRNVERTVTVFGSFLAREQATVSTKVQGRLASVSVDIGSVVEAGGELARMEPREYELRLRQAEASLAQALARLALSPADESVEVDPENASVVRQAAAVLREATSNRERMIKLFQQGVLSQAELDSAEAAFIIAENRHQDALEDVRQRIALVSQRKAERDIAVQQLTDTKLSAPFNAAVQDRRASVGEYLRVGDPVITLVQMNPLRLRLEVTERDAPRVRLGQSVRVRVEGLTNQFNGRIERISPAIDQQRRVLLVEADIPNDGLLHPGMFAKAEIVVVPDDPALTVPVNAVSTFAGIEKVFTIVEGKAAERVITTGQRADETVEILGNLKAGEEVILDPGKLQNGQTVLTGSPSAGTPSTPQS